MAQRGRSRVPESQDGDLFTVEELFLEYNRLAVKCERYFRAQREFDGSGHAFGHHKITKEEALWRGIYSKEVLMARASHQRDAINSKIKGLEPAFPSSPSRPPRYAVTFERNGRMHSIHTFYATYGAKKFIEAVLDGSEYKWLNDYTIATDEVTIKCEPNLEEIIEHEYTKAEAEWELPDPYPAEARSIATGIRVRIEPKQTTSDTPEPERIRSPKRERKPSKDGLIDIGTIADELKIEPRQARAQLRKANVEKPASGWAWPEADVPRIKAIIKGEANEQSIRAGDSKRRTRDATDDDEPSSSASRNRQASSREHARSDKKRTRHR